MMATATTAPATRPRYYPGTPTTAEAQHVTIGVAKC